MLKTYFILEGFTYQITVDYFSRWIEISFLESTTTNSVIKKLKGIFSRFGIVEKIRTDGGPQFISQEFRQFCRQNEISHSVSDPYLAQGNGAAERSVQTAKRILKTDDPTTALMEYRSTPMQVTGYAPSQLLMGRIIKTNLPLSDDILQPNWPDMEDVRHRDEKAKEKNRQNFNRTHGAKPLPPIPAGSYVRERKGNEKTWSEPVLSEKPIGDRSYAVRNRRHLKYCPVITNRYANNSHNIQIPVNRQHSPSPVNQQHPTSPAGHQHNNIKSPATSITTRYGRVTKPVIRLGLNHVQGGDV